MSSEKYHNNNTLKMAQDGRKRIETIFSSEAELRNKDFSETVLKRNEIFVRQRRVKISLLISFILLSFGRCLRKTRIYSFVKMCILW